jgi:potassium efflux system protein
MQFERHLCFALPTPGRLPHLLRVAATIFLILAVLTAAPVQAREGGKIEEPYATWESTAELAQDVLEKGDTSTSALEQLRARLSTQREAAFEIVQSGSVKVRTLQAQLESLGPAPADGQSEPEGVASRRSELSKALALASRPILASREAYRRADLLIAEVDSQIRARTRNKLLTRNPMPLAPANLLTAYDEVRDYGARLAGEVRLTLRHDAERVSLRDKAPSLIILILAGALMIGLAPAILARRLMRAAKKAQGDWRRLACLVSCNLCYLIFPATGAAALILAVELAGVTPASAYALVGELPSIAAALIFAHWLGRSLFMPVRDDIRLIALEKHAADWGVHFAHAIGLVLGIEIAVEAIERDHTFSAATAAVVNGTVVLVGGLLLLGLARLFLHRHQYNATEPEDQEQPAEPGFLRLLARLMQISAVIAIVVATIGYDPLARQALIPMITSIGLIGLAYFMLRVIMAAIGIITGHDYAAGDDDSSLLPIAVISLLGLALLPVMALAWGARTADIAEVWRLLIDGVEFGDTRLSLEGIIKLIVAFGIGMLLTRWLQKLLRTTVLPRTRLDAGGKTALVTGVGYVGITLAALVAISAAGLNLSNLAVVAGALSVGIGFGLQTIVSNFVSGIILLVERPIKEGDWIEVSGYSGIVRKIAVRSTRIETFDQHDVIVPNSDLIAGAVKNMTLSSKSGRLVVPVGVAYGSDLEATRAILLAAAAKQPMVMKHPEPAVMFMGLGDSSLDFELRCYLRDVGAVVSTRSDMLFQIYAELGKAGIEIPFPQRDIHLRDFDRLIEAIAGRTLGTAKRGQTAEPGDESKN